MGDWSGADDDRCPTGIAVAVGAVALIATAALGAVVTEQPALRLGGLVLAAAAFAAVFGDSRAALAVAALAWPIGNGFLVDRFGELRWHAGLDGWFVGGLVAAVAVGMTVAQIRRELRSHARVRPIVALLQDASPDAAPGGAHAAGAGDSESAVTDGRIADGAGKGR
jgi:hypothetical protein